MKKYVLAIDPSGAFREGKGTTGWCFMDTAYKEVIKCGSIYATDYPKDVSYWAAHIELLEEYKRTYGAANIAVVMEDYLLYAGKTQSQINSRFETSQLIGILKYTCHLLHLMLYMQTASEVVTRWNNKVLIHKCMIKPCGKQFTLGDGTRTNRHELDALRHALHFSYFYNK